MPCLIRYGMTDEMVVAAQIQANAIRPDDEEATDFARQLKKILDANPGMSHARLQGMIHKSPHWIGEQLGLLRLQPAIQKAVDRGEIPLMSAYVLSRVIYSQQAPLCRFCQDGPRSTCSKPRSLSSSSSSARRRGRGSWMYSSTTSSRPSPTFAICGNFDREETTRDGPHAAWPPAMRGRPWTVGTPAWIGSCTSTPRAWKSSEESYGERTNAEALYRGDLIM